MDNKSISKNFLYTFLLNIVNLVFPLFSFTYTSRILGPELMGRINFAGAFSEYFILLASLGIPGYGIREIAKNRNCKEKLRKVFFELFLLNLLFTITFLIIYTIIILFYFRSKEVFGLLILNMINIIFSLFSFDWFLGGLEEYEYIAKRNIIIKTIALILLFLVVRTEKDYYTYVIIGIFAFSFTNVFSLYKVMKIIRIKIINVDLIKHIKPLMWISVAVLVGSIYTRLDTILLGILSTEKNVGYYTAVKRITNILIVGSSVLTMVTAPRMSYLFENKDEKAFQEMFKKSLDLVYFITIPITIFIIIFAKEIIFVFAGEKYVEAVKTLMIMSPTIILISLSGIIGLQILVPTNNEKLLTITSSVAAFISIVLNIALIPYLKDFGAALTLFIVELIILIMEYKYINKLFKIGLFTKNLKIYSIISIIIFFLLIAIKVNVKNSIFTLLLGGVTTIVIYYCSLKKRNDYYVEYIEKKILKGVDNVRFNKKEN